MSPGKAKIPHAIKAVGVADMIPDFPFVEIEGEKGYAFNVHPTTVVQDSIHLAFLWLNGKCTRMKMQHLIGESSRRARHPRETVVASTKYRWRFDTEIRQYQD